MMLFYEIGIGSARNPKTRRKLKIRRRSRRSFAGATQRKVRRAGPFYLHGLFCRFCVRDLRHTGDCAASGTRGRQYFARGRTDSTRPVML